MVERLAQYFSWRSSASPRAHRSVHMGAWAPLLLGFFLVLFRCTALLMAAPLFSARAVNARIRMGLALAVAWICLLRRRGRPGSRDWAQPGPLLLAVVGETLIGLSAGLAAASRSTRRRRPVTPPASPWASAWRR